MMKIEFQYLFEYNTANEFSWVSPMSFSNGLKDSHQILLDR